MVKFDVVVGNPPYQESGDSNRDNPIYHKFMDASYEVGDRSILITPARFLFDSGQTPKAWNRKMLSDKHLKVISFEPKSTNVFDNTDIMGGVAITYRDVLNVSEPINTFIPFVEFENIIDKITKVEGGDYSNISDIAFSSSAYRLNEKLYIDYPDAKESISKSNRGMMSTNIYSKIPYMFSDDVFDGCLGIQMRVDSKVTIKYIDRAYVNPPANIDMYKVVLSNVYGTDLVGGSEAMNVIGKPKVLGKGIGSNQTYLTIGSFSNKTEAENLNIYIKSKFTRAMLGVLKVSQLNPPEKWKFVPLQDFTKDSDIDWSKSIKEIDQQLYAKYGLSDEEITFIETHVKEME